MFDGSPTTLVTDVKLGVFGTHAPDAETQHPPQQRAETETENTRGPVFTITFNEQYQYGLYRDELIFVTAELVSTLTDPTNAASATIDPGPFSILPVESLAARDTERTIVQTIADEAETAHNHHNCSAPNPIRPLEFGVGHLTESDTNFFLLDFNNRVCFLAYSALAELVYLLLDLDFALPDSEAFFTEVGSVSSTFLRQFFSLNEFPTPFKQYFFAQFDHLPPSDSPQSGTADTTNQDTDDDDDDDDGDDDDGFSTIQF
jgi:hypothetical protein